MDENKIRTIRPEWDLVSQKLLLVDLTVARWRAKTKNEFSDFGLDGKAFSAYTAGSRRLLPKRLQDELDLLERLARALQKKYSFETTFGRMMPKARYEDFKKWIEEKPAAELRRYLHSKDDSPVFWNDRSLKDRWFELADQIAQQRDAIVDELVESYKPAITVRWRVENGLAQDADVTPPDEFLEEQARGMIGCIPTAEEIRDSFRLTITPAFIEMPSEAVKEAKLKDLKAKESDLDRRLEELSDEKLWADKAIEYQRIQAEKERLAMERRITDEVMRAEAAARKEKITKTLDEISGALHTELYGLVYESLEYLKANNKLHPRTAGRIKAVAEQVTLLNSGFMGDAELERITKELTRLHENGAAGKDNADKAREALRDIGISIKADLVAAGIPTRSARDLGIPDHPAEDLVRRARREERPLLDAIEAAADKPIALERGARSLNAAA